MGQGTYSKVFTDGDGHVFKIQKVSQGKNKSNEKNEEFEKNGENRENEEKNDEKGKLSYNIFSK